MLVAALALTHQDAEAREALHATSRCPPAGRSRRSRRRRRTTSAQGWLPAEVSERVYDGLRKAGMPEE